jgi:hypothetical protein
MKRIYGKEDQLRDLLFDISKCGSPARQTKTLTWNNRRSLILLNSNQG